MAEKEVDKSRRLGNIISISSEVVYLKDIASAFTQDDSEDEEPERPETPENQTPANLDEPQWQTKVRRLALQHVSNATHAAEVTRDAFQRLNAKHKRSRDSAPEIATLESWQRQIEG
ncbi:Laminin subunit beta-4-like [Lasiodiplodia theobromae]|uniref:Uncharacterized protein n=1 Tax=Lasiodiplodia theobromae TaxID=45133 RepID=A0A5N5DCR4_9PEZI|nr:Laminin subunit beta-4-like [Lasiodiplodia theobromae]KAB2575539.1 hypothetical protein DBV05_g5782 [Lasiodiplodia theobromae]KAF4536290.1 Laminin subunit beta-4-like [Lasiodiplodia theobromae]